MSKQSLISTVGVEWLYYSPMRQQWCSAFNTNGTVEGLIIRGWFSSKAEAKADVKRALRFREGLVANCEPILNLIERLERI